MQQHSNQEDGGSADVCQRHVSISLPLYVPSPVFE
jgi:hypothetical protein